MARRKVSPTCELRSHCPISGVLDLLGDKWTLLLIRDMMFVGKARYNDFLESPEGIPTNILADRLKKLQDNGLIDAVPYQNNPVRHEYKLTPAAMALKPILVSLAKWGVEHIPGTSMPTAAQLKKFRAKYGK